MGRGDRRTFRGKLSICSYGVSRPHKLKTSKVGSATGRAASASKPTVKKAAPKKKAG